MPFLLPKIYPITDISITKLSHLEQVEKLIAGGATLIQLRDKNSTPKDFYESAKAVMDYVKDKNVKIIINDRVDIALFVKADGVHLGQDDLLPKYARQILGKKAIIGFSTHNIWQAIKAVKMPLDYIAIGPIFSTKTKENPDPAVGIEGLKTVRNEIGNFPLVGIGGITLQNAQEVLQNGANSVAVINEILHEPAQITQTFKQFVEHL